MRGKAHRQIQLFNDVSPEPGVRPEHRLRADPRDCRCGGGEGVAAEAPAGARGGLSVGRGTMTTLCYIAALSVLTMITPSVGMSCVGDCDGDKVVDITDLITGVRAALEEDTTAACPHLDRGDGRVDVSDLIYAVNEALSGCQPDVLNYTLVGTINDEPATGEFVMVLVDLEPNVENWNIVGFRFGGFIGFGSATFVTDGTFTTYLLVQGGPDLPEMFLVGVNGAARESEFIFSEFNLVGDDLIFRFLATLSPRSEGVSEK